MTNTIFIYTLAAIIAAIGGAALSPKVNLNPCAIVSCHSGPR
jgi:hypothetical protein